MLDRVLGRRLAAPDRFDAEHPEIAAAGLRGQPGSDRQGQALALALDFHHHLAALSAEVLDHRADVVEIPDRLAVDGGDAVVLGQHAPGRGVGPDLAHHRRQQRLARSEEHTSELQSLMRISYAVFCLKKKTKEYKVI